MTGTQPQPHRDALPFSAIVGQPALTRALALIAINPRLGGVLIRGEKGTAKSTAARALARLLPDVKVVAGCAFGCLIDQPTGAYCAECRVAPERRVETRAPRFCTLPLGISEDQLLGSIDLEVALKEGERRFRPGLLAEANHGLLYVDEVNLLDDHLVDLLLDVAATGVNLVAHDGLSIAHPARFSLVGTMNPEEGELRPQLLDRFGLCVDIAGLDDAGQRADVIERSLAFERDPRAFRARWQERELALSERIAAARAALPEIPCDRRWALAAAELALRVGVDGHRADLLLVKAAKTLAALAGRKAIGADDLADAATVVIPHRLRRRPFDEPMSVTSADLRQAALEAVARTEKKKPER